MWYKICISFFIFFYIFVYVVDDWMQVLTAAVTLACLDSYFGFIFFLLLSFLFRSYDYLLQKSFIRWGLAQVWFCVCLYLFSHQVGGEQMCQLNDMVFSELFNLHYLLFVRYKINEVI